MPIAEHSIEALDANGNPLSPVVKATFLSWKGDPQFRQQTSEALQCAGVDGHGFRRLGKRGKPFKLISKIDVETIADGVIGYQIYIDSFVMENPCLLKKDGASFGTFVVLSVELMGLKASPMAGGLGPTAAPPYDSNFLLTCRWTLTG